MAFSMTGFGRGEASSATRAFTAEIRAVNHRYCDITIKMPRPFMNFEERLRQIIAQNIGRGKVDVYINYEEFGDREHNVTADASLAKAYMDAAGALKAQFGLRDDVSLSTLLRIPDIIKIENADPDEEEIWNLLSASVQAAVGALVSMRGREGEKLAGDISRRLEALSALIEKVAERAPAVIGEYRERLNARLAELLGANVIDENRIAAEIVLFAERCGIDEEIIRYRSHLAQAAGCLSSGEAVGRKLDFLLQEINREVNTIGSKANDLIISEKVVEMKTEAEKIREQIQNLE